MWLVTILLKPSHSWMFLFECRGWNYVSCIESIMKDNSLEMNAKCILSLQNCRNVLHLNPASEKTTEYSDQYVLNIFVALVAGIIGVAIMVSSFIVKRRRIDSSVEFTRIEQRSLT